MSRSLEHADASVQTILPVLKTFSSNEVAIVGCHASSFSRQSCEYDLLLIGPDPVPQKFARVGEVFARLIFKSEREVRSPEPELAVELSRAVPLRDNSLLLGSVISHCRKALRSNCRRATESHLAGALKALGRVDELLPRGDPREADFWLLTAGCEFARAELYSRWMPPSPSHILSQMKGSSKRKGSDFRHWAEASGLELASRTSCENRLEALVVLYDVLATAEMDSDISVRLNRYRAAEAVEVMRRKSRELLDSMQSVECYAFLGQEVARSVSDLYILHSWRNAREADYSSVIGDLASGGERLISGEVIRLLGLVRTPEIMTGESAALKQAVASLAKKI